MNGRWRWLAVSVFALSASLNYLDRSLLNVLAVSIKAEFGLSNEQFGWLGSAFSATYILGAPAMGLLLDRLGLRWGAAIAVSLWSLAGMATAWVQGLGSLTAARMGLGLFEGASTPGTSKSAAIYLRPEERALGAAVTQGGLALGTIAAPLLAAHFAAWYGWRATFALAGGLGFVWVPLWLLVSRWVPPLESGTAGRQDSSDALLRDGRLWPLVTGNALTMACYSLWNTWLVLFLVSRFGLTQGQANARYAWLPMICGTLGGSFGGWLALREIRRGRSPVSARLRICWGAALAVAATAVLPLVTQVEWGVGLISLSLFATVTMSVNVYALPLDLFPASRAAFAVSLLTAGFGAISLVLSPAIGRVVDRSGYGPVCVAVPLLPVLGVALIQWGLRRR